MEHMNKSALIKKMQRELLDYQIGLHNIGFKKYIDIIENWSSPRKELFRINEEINDFNIAKHILENGLNIVEMNRGLSSTVKILPDLTPNSLNYTYNYYEPRVVWNVIFGLPDWLYYREKYYYIGDLKEYTNIANLMLYNPCVYKEFIYGIYGLEIVDKVKDSSGFERLIYSDTLDFLSNREFFAYLNSEERQFILEKIFSEKKRLLSNIKAANSSTIALIPKTPYERMIIKATKKQNKVLNYQRRNK